MWCGVQCGVETKLQTVPCVPQVKILKTDWARILYRPQSREFLSQSRRVSNSQHLNNTPATLATPPHSPHSPHFKTRHSTLQKLQNLERNMTKSSDISSPNVFKTSFPKKEQKSDGSHVYFGSGARNPYYKLSNFNQCSIIGKVWVKTENGRYESRVYTFPSSEHYWCAMFFVDDKDIRRIAVGGDLSTLESGLSLIYRRKEEYEKKLKYWSSKDNVGIVVKLLANRKKNKNNGREIRWRAAMLGMNMSIHPCSKYGPQGADSTLNKMWEKILLAKYTQNSEHRRVLMDTGSRMLVEFSRASVKKLSNEFWAGRFVGTRLVGNNYMGECMMSCRDCFK